MPSSDEQADTVTDADFSTLGGIVRSNSIIRTRSYLRAITLDNDNPLAVSMSPIYSTQNGPEARPFIGSVQIDPSGASVSKTDDQAAAAVWENERATRISLSMLGWSLGIGSIGGTWKTVVGGKLGLWIFRCCSTFAWVFLVWAMYRALFMWCQKPCGWTSHPMSGSTRLKVLAALCPGTMALMVASSNFKRWFCDNDVVDTVSQIIFNIGLALHLLVFAAVFCIGSYEGIMKWTGKGEKKCSVYHFALAPLFLVPPVGTGISFLAVQNYGAGYKEVAWVLLCFGICNVIVWVIPEIIFSMEVLRHVVPTDLALLPIFIAPPSLTLTAFFGLTRREYSRSSYAGMDYSLDMSEDLRDAIIYTLMTILGIACLVTVISIPTIFHTIRKTDSAPYYASATFPTAAMSSALLGFASAKHSNTAEKIAWVVMGISSLIIIAVFLAIIKALIFEPILKKSHTPIYDDEVEDDPTIASMI